MKTPKNMPEEFLQYIWESKLFDSENIRTTSGRQLEILHPGKRNTDSGPDFFNAKIKIGETIWAGNIEIHTRASDWERHHHHLDPAYNNIILHVVGEHDAIVLRKNNEEIPTLVLRYPEHLQKNYQELLDSKTWVACKNQFHKLDPVLLQLGFNRLMIERLEHKTEEILTRLEQNNNDWNETFYQTLARMFGFKINAVPFELLARSAPMRLLSKHKNNLFQLEALLFGNSGLLNQHLLGDEYFLRLREEYSFLYKKYKLKAIEGHLWKFMRLRPVNFPTVRIAQLAALIHHSNGLFSELLETESIEKLKTLFRVKASNYWDAHYNFNKKSKSVAPKEMGEASANILITNVLIPFLFVYGEKLNKKHLKDRALEFLEKLPAENNAIIKKWCDMGIVVHSSFESQALLQLKNCYCEAKKCLNCHIGVKLVATTQKP